jgi:hypothetical protein
MFRVALLYDLKPTGDNAVSELACLRRVVVVWEGLPDGGMSSWGMRKSTLGLEW